jgi:hypothetical protein
MNIDEQVLEVRNISIECMSRLDRAAAVVKQGSSESFFHSYRRACGDVMGRVFYELISYTRALLPPLSDEDFLAQWRGVVHERTAADPSTPPVDPREAVLGQLQVVSDRLRTLTSSFLADEFKSELSSSVLEPLFTLLDDWQ